MVKRFLLRAVVACLVILSGSFSALAKDEYALKSSLVLNFIKFIEWPDGSDGKRFKNDICVIGKSELADYGELFKAASYSFAIEKNIANITSHCSILFIGQSEDGRLREILDVLKSHPVLTIADSAEFAERGVMIGFTFSESKIRFVVNNAAIKRTKIIMDSGMLEIALKVIDR